MIGEDPYPALVLLCIGNELCLHWYFSVFLEKGSGAALLFRLRVPIFVYQLEQLSMLT